MKLKEIGNLLPLPRPCSGFTVLDHPALPLLRGLIQGLQNIGDGAGAMPLGSDSAEAETLLLHFHVIYLYFLHGPGLDQKILQSHNFVVVLLLLARLPLARDDLAPNIVDGFRRIGIRGFD